MNTHPDSALPEIRPVEFRFDHYRFTTHPLTLHRDSEVIPLQPQPGRVLLRLLEARPHTVSREELRQLLWGSDHYIDHEQGINFAIRSIRSALGEEARHPRFVETVPRQGYRFIAPLEWRPKVAADQRRPGHRPLGGLVLIGLAAGLLVAAWGR